MKESNITIRNGKAEDMEAIWKLIRELAAFEREPEAVVISPSDLIRDGFGETPLFHTFVAEDASGIIGMALFYYRYSTWKGRTIHLEDLIVTESARGTGAGQALYQAVLDKGKADGVRRVEWAVLNWNEPAIRFYEKSGAKVLEDWRVVQMDQETLKATSA